MGMQKVTKLENFSSRCVSLEIYEQIKTRYQNENTCELLTFSTVMVF